MPVVCEGASRMMALLVNRAGCLALLDNALPARSRLRWSELWYSVAARGH